MKEFRNFRRGAGRVADQGRTLQTFNSINAIAVMEIFFHLIYTVLFVFVALHPVLMVYKVVVILADIAALWLNKKGAHHAACIVLTIEIGFSSLVWVVFLGAGTYMELLLLCGVPAHYLFVDIGKRRRRMLMAFLAVMLNLCYLCMAFMEPVIPGVNTAPIAVLTINVLVGVLLVEMSLSRVATVTAQKNMENTIAREKDISMKDLLTGLWNRRYIQLQEARYPLLSENIPISIAMLDLDHFKMINDAYGHAVGDMLLRHFSKLLKTSFRSTDVAVRWGGEEFLLLLIGVNTERAQKMITAFLEKTQNSPLFADNGSIIFSFTAGVSSLSPSQTLTEAIELADRRMYIGKKLGRCCVIINDDKSEVV